MGEIHQKSNNVIYEYIHHTVEIMMKVNLSYVFNKKREYDIEIIY